MKKFAVTRYVCVPVTKIVEAEDEFAANMETEDDDFRLDVIVGDTRGCALIAQDGYQSLPEFWDYEPNYDIAPEIEER